VTCKRRAIHDSTTSLAHIAFNHRYQRFDICSTYEVHEPGVVLASPRSLVTYALEKIETIKPGMTREDLLSVFTTEGGLSTGLHRTFVSRDCHYFKVDVEFEAVGRPNRDEEGRTTLDEDSR